MIRTSFISAFLWAILFFLASCEKETALSVDQSSIEISDAGGSSAISLTANKPWTASSNQSWCKVSPSAGEDATNGRITITCDANTTYDARNCMVTFTCAELTKTVSVSQATNNGLLVSQTEYNITNAAQQLEIMVQANVKFSVEVDNGCKDWVKYNTTKGLTTSTVVLDIAKNETYDNREGKVTIKQEGGNLSSSVVIKQGQTNGLFLTTSEYNLSNEKHTLTVEVKSNIEFEVKSEADWIKYIETKGLKTNQIVLDVEANETYDTREGKVTVKQKNGNLTGTITIGQDQNYGLFVSPEEIRVSNQASVVEIEVRQNVAYDIIIPENAKEWVKIVSTKDLQNEKISLSIANNPLYVDRETTITLKQTDGALSTTVRISQEQTEFISIDLDDIKISHEKQLLDVVVHTNTQPEIIIENDCSSWISLASRADSVFSFSIAQNKGTTEREGTVVLKGNNVEVLFKIKQMAEVFVEIGSIHFLYYCTKHFDTNKDNRISLQEAAAVKRIEVPHCHIDQLTGIEHFINLEYLDCSENPLYDIDLSCNTKLKVLKTDASPLGELDLSNNRHIDSLSCMHNGLSSLDLSNLSSLVYLECSDNFRMPSLDLSHNEKLTVLGCKGNRMPSLDISNNPLLEQLWCYDNDLTSLDVTHNTELRVLLCYMNKLSDLDISNNKKLQTFDCCYNRIATLDASANNELVYLGCWVNGLTELKLPEGTHDLRIDCQINALNELDLSNCKTVKNLNCSGNHISLLDLSVCSRLDTLNCSSNVLTNLDACSCKHLSLLNCSDNPLEKLDISECSNLLELNCWNDNLSTLDVSNSLNLYKLSCSDNPYLKELWLKIGQSITYLTYDSSITTIKYKE